MSSKHENCPTSLSYSTSQKSNECQSCSNGAPSRSNGAPTTIKPVLDALLAPMVRRKWLRALPPDTERLLTGQFCLQKHHHSQSTPPQIVSRLGSTSLFAIISTKTHEVLQAVRFLAAQDLGLSNDCIKSMLSGNSGAQEDR